ncbi:hypothetical protein FOCC_FOCC014896, partial [Frankliniella occidentalis]
LNVFRFSISWTRIFPTRTNETKNQKGIDHYHSLLDELKKHNIEPMVTMFHFDYPQALEDAFGGWLGNEMLDEFEAYADFLFKEYGSKGSAWVLREMPLWIKNRYEKNGRKLPVFITENGINAAGNKSSLNDWDERAVYASAFLRELAAGINENGTNVFGYTMWSLLDTFEFHSFRVSSTHLVPLVEAGSEPFPDDSGSAKLTSSSAMLLVVGLFAKLML